ncbi:MAG: hypothetical protein ACQKBY_06210, partial [Verrucomicrobiales bacterium]
QAAENPEEAESLIPKAVAAVDTIFSHAEELKDHHKLLAGEATSSVFAKAYEINHLKLEKIPASPLDLQNIYDKLVFPKLRQPDSIPSLRNAWDRRIKQEGMKLEFWSAEGSVRDTLPPAYQKWLETTRLDLLWAKEVDTFKAGAERSAAMAMLTLIQDHLSYQNASKWISEFTELMGSGENSPESAPPND